MKKSPIYRRNQIGGSLFENAQTLEALSKQYYGTVLKWLREGLDINIAIMNCSRYRRIMGNERLSNEKLKPHYNKNKTITIDVDFLNTGLKYG